MQKVMQISKLDAARRQTETAIRLYFSNCDPVSIHTLISASYNVIRDINKKRGGEDMIMKDLLMKRVKEGYEKEVWQLINQAENFFKHADRDHEETLDFNPDQSEFVLFESITTYFKLTGEFPPIFKAYQTWFIANHQNLFNLSEDEERVISLGAQEILELGKESFFNWILPKLTIIN